MKFRRCAWLPLLLPLLVLACGDDGTRSRQEGVIPTEELEQLIVPDDELTDDERLLKSTGLTQQEVSEVFPGRTWEESGQPERESITEEMRAGGVVAGWSGHFGSEEGLVVGMLLFLYDAADQASAAHKELVGQPKPEGLEVFEFDTGDIGDEAQGSGNRDSFSVSTSIALRVDRVLASVDILTGGERERQEARQLAHKLAEKIEAAIQG